MSDRKPPETPDPRPEDAGVDIIAIAAGAGIERAVALYPGDVMAAWRNAMRSRAGLVRSLPPEIEPHVSGGGARS